MTMYVAGQQLVLRNFQGPNLRGFGYVQHNSGTRLLGATKAISNGTSCATAKADDCKCYFIDAISAIGEEHDSRQRCAGVLPAQLVRR